MYRFQACRSRFTPLLAGWRKRHGGHFAVCVCPGPVICGVCVLIIGVAVQLIVWKVSNDSEMTYGVLSGTLNSAYLLNLQEKVRESL